MLNEYCACTEHIKKAKHTHVIRFAGIKVEIPLCSECYQMVASGRFTSYTP